MHACRQEAIEDLKQGALKEETEETKDDRKLRKPKVECSVFKRELHSEESEDAEEGPASPEEDSAPDAATQVVQSRGSSLFQDDGSSDNDLFKNRFCRKSLRVKSEAADADRWASLPKTLKKDIVGAFDEAVLQSVPDECVSRWHISTATRVTTAVCSNSAFPRCDLNLFMQVLLREQMTTMNNVLDVCRIEGRCNAPTRTGEGCS